MNIKQLTSSVHFFILCIVSIPVFSQVFDSKTTLYTTQSAFQGWYTESVYSPIDSYNGVTYFVMLDKNRVPQVGEIKNGVTTLEALEKSSLNYKPLDDGHQEYSLGIDKDGYIHITGDLHNFPQGNDSHIPPAYDGSNILYWKSKNPADISDFEFIGLKASETIPGIAWSYGNFVTDRNGELYYISRTLARKYYYQNGGRGQGLYWYDSANKKWIARGVKAPISDASYPVICWEESGQNARSYQQYKGNIRFDKNNRMHFTTSMNTQNGSAQVNSIVYAYSDDGGVTFHKANGDLITLPMEIKASSRQGDVIDSDPTATFEQPSLTYAFNNQPIINYTVNGSEYYKYWTGTSWSSRKNSPLSGNRGRLLFNDHKQELLFINISDGKIFAKSSFEGNNTTYNAGTTFRYFDIKTFQKQNTLTGISWKASTGVFEVIQLNGGQIDCFGTPGGSAKKDQCNVCSGGNSGIEVDACLKCGAPVASSEDGLNVASNVIDDDLNTRWAALGVGEYIDLCLGTNPISLKNVSLAFYKGDERIANFDIQTSMDGINWSTIYANGASSGTTLDLETYSFTPKQAWKVRLIGKGNNSSTSSEWNSITEIKFNTIITSSHKLIPNTYNLYPNPTTGIITINSEDLKTVTNTLGEVVFETKDSQLNLQALKAGIYFIQVGNERLKVVKE